MVPQTQTVWTPALPLSYTRPHIVTPSSIEIVEGADDRRKVDAALVAFAEHNRHATPIQLRENALIQQRYFNGLRLWTIEDQLRAIQAQLTMLSDQSAQLVEERNHLLMANGMIDSVVGILEEEVVERPSPEVVEDPRTPTHLEGFEDMYVDATAPANAAAPSPNEPPAPVPLPASTTPLDAPLETPRKEEDNAPVPTPPSP